MTFSNPQIVRANPFAKCASLACLAVLFALAAHPSWSVDEECAGDALGPLPDDALPDEIEAQAREALRRSLLRFDACLPSMALHADDAGDTNDAKTGRRADAPAPRSNVAAQGGDGQPGSHGGGGSQHDGSQQADAALPGSGESSSPSEQEAVAHETSTPSDGGGCGGWGCASPYSEDELARALRERAGRESDPKIARELWRVYRDYVDESAGGAPHGG